MSAAICGYCGPGCRFAHPGYRPPQCDKTIATNPSKAKTVSDQAIPATSDPSDAGSWLPWRWRRKDHSAALSGFRDSLTREILLTERLRIKAVILTASLLTLSFTVLHFAAPSVLERIT